MTLSQTPLFSDFCDFAKAQLRSRDIDPMYPVLKAYFQSLEISQADKIWRTAVYVTFYHIGSAYQVWSHYPSLTQVRIGALPTGIERRGFRGNLQAQANLNSLIGLCGGDIQGWLESAVERGWDAVRKAYEEIAYNGVWASYKWADLVKHTLGYSSLVATDIGVGGNGKEAGPIPGLARLTGKSWQECVKNKDLQRDFLENCLKAGVPFSGFEELETALCDFNSLCKGSYYVGHDIDMMMLHLPSDKAFWQARRDCIPAEYLGELNGWKGVRKPLKSYYKDKGVLLL